MNCCKHKYFVIYRGDDTDFPGNQELIVELNTERDLTGCSAHFSFQGFTQDFSEIPSDKKLRLIIPNSATSKFPIGAADAKLWLTNGTKVRTVESRIHIVVTNRVDEAYDNDDPQAITVTIKGTDLTWENIKNKPLLVKTVNGEAPDEDGNVDVTAIAEGAVQYDREQTLTEQQKTQARTNIGAMSADTPIPDVAGKLPLRPLPKYLHYLAFDDTYPEDAQAWYESLAPDAMGGACSAVRKGGLLGRNYDWFYDEASEFVVKLCAAKGANADGSDRHASVGVASLGASLTEDEVASGVHTTKYRALPGMTLDGINDAGVVAEINVIPRGEDDPAKGGTRNLHPLAVVRYVLDNFATAEEAATYAAAHYYIPETSAYSFHWMIADANETWIVEDGDKHEVTGADGSMTNYRLYAEDMYGTGYARKEILDDAENVGAALAATHFTNAYAEGWPWPDEFAMDAEIPHTETDALKAWADAHVTPHLGPDRQPKARDGVLWHTVHSTIYDFAAKTMKVAVQEVDDWYVFAVDQANVDLGPIEAQIAALQSGKANKSETYTKAETDAKLGGKRDIDDLKVYERSWVFSGSAVTHHGYSYRIDFEKDELIDEYELKLFRIVPGGDDLQVDAKYPVNPEETHFSLCDTYIEDEYNSVICDKVIEETDTLALVSQLPTAAEKAAWNGKQSKITASGVLKGDGSGGVTAATKSSASSDPANADYRDPQDNTCHKTEYGKWVGVFPEGFPPEDFLDQPSYNHDETWSWIGGGFIFNALGGEDDTTLEFYFNETGDPDPSVPHFTATRSAVCTDGKKFVTEDVAAKQSDIFGNDGKPTDTFATDLIGKPVAIQKIDERLPIQISEKNAGFTTESYKRFVVTVGGNMTVTLHTPTAKQGGGYDAEVFECRFDGASLAADASIAFDGATATTMDTNCGTVTAGKVALMSAFWNGATWDVNWKVEG